MLKLFKMLLRKSFSHGDFSQLNIGDVVGQHQFILTKVNQFHGDAMQFNMNDVVR